MKKVVVAGEVLVEIMADEQGVGFLSPISLTGPYPSGAPAIFIDQVARMGQPCAIISTVGDDDFGRVNINRLRDDGVDVSAIAIDAERPTGSAFVRYRPDGSRDFVFNIRHSACGKLPEDKQADAAVLSADHLHVMGSSLSSPEIVEFNLRSARNVKNRGGTVSFDPNLRKEMLAAPGMKGAMKSILNLADIFLPSGEELCLLAEAKDEKEAVKEILQLGVSAVIHKRGADGVSYYDGDIQHSITAFPVVEVDPTGAGDCFGGAFVSMWLRGGDVREALLLAAAAGALAVTRRGPMEGAHTFSEIRDFISNQTEKQK